MLAGQGGALACGGSRAQLPCALARRGASGGHGARWVAAPAVRVRAAANRAPLRAVGSASAARDGEAAQGEPQKRRQRAPRVGELGEKTADGKPKPDERTVADLIERGWLETEEDAEALLTRLPSRTERFAFETAKPTADWLEATLGRVPLKGGVLPAAKAVQRYPDLLFRDAATLQRNWDALTLPAEQGGVGIAFSQEQAREAVLKNPQILPYATDTLKRGWSMLTATEGGLGLSPDEARSCILRNPAVLRFDHDAAVRRGELLKTLGYPKAYEMVLKEPRVLAYTEETVRENAAWWKQTGLDHTKIIESEPTLLGCASTKQLAAKLGFLRHVARLSVSDLNNAAPLLSYSLEKTLRPRFFYALANGALERCKLSTLTVCSTATYLRKVHQFGMPASEDEVDRFNDIVASAKFQAWANAQEETLRRGGAAVLPDRTPAAT